MGTDLIFYWALFALLQHEKHGRSNNRQYDRDGSECPSPITLMESLGNLGSGIGSNDVWRRGKCVCETSVLEVRSIGSEDIDAEDHTGESDRCEDLRSALT